LDRIEESKNEDNRIPVQLIHSVLTTSSCLFSLNSSLNTHLIAIKKEEEEEGGGGENNKSYWIPTGFLPQYLDIELNHLAILNQV